MGLFRHFLIKSWESFIIIFIVYSFSIWYLYDYISTNWKEIEKALYLYDNLLFVDFEHTGTLDLTIIAIQYSWVIWDEFYTSTLSISNFFFDIWEYPFFMLFGFLFFFSSVFSLFFLSYLGFYGIFYLNLITLVAFWLSFFPYISYVFTEGGFYYINIGKWMFINSSYRVFFDFFIDSISFSFAFLTLTIAVFVYMFTFSYFRYEPLVDRLLVLLNLFIISMIFLVTAGNLISLFLGWELIGLTSFFLINFWVNKVSTLKAAFKAFSFNKLSDFFLLLNIFLIFNSFFTLDIMSLSLQAVNYSTKVFNCNFLFIVSLNDVICFLFLGCAFIKSAQIGAHIWLPDSMEAPVPASALIHSATLVSAGIFLLLRFNFFFDTSITSRVIICTVGAITAFYGGLVAMYQSDTKKILAYSTISHCGFLMVLVSFHIIEFTLIYLYVHGFFKAAVFMCIGNVNRLNKNNQDFKQMGMFYKFLPFDCIMCFVGLINLAGLPFTLGFFIKHLMFIAININFILYYFILINLIFGALTGLFYCSRLFFFVFFDFKKSRSSIYYGYSRQNFNSIFYSNTTFLSNFAILGLFFFAYIFSFYLLHIYLNSLLNYSDLNELFKSTNFFFSFISNKWLLFNFSIINWISLITIFIIIFTNWRKTIQEFNIQWLFWFFFFLHFFVCFI